MRSNVILNVVTEKGTVSAATLYQPTTIEIIRRLEKFVDEEDLEKVIFVYGKGEVLSVPFPLSKEKAEVVAKIVTEYL